MKKYLYFQFLFLFLFELWASQNNFFATGKALEQVKHILEQTKTNKIRQFASFDVQELLNEDSQNKNMDVPFRFGKAFDTNITLSDGEWEEVEMVVFGRWNFNQEEHIQLILFLMDFFFQIVQNYILQIKLELCYMVQ